MIKRHMKIMILVLSITVLIGYNAYLNRHIQISEYRVNSKKLPASFDSFRIVQVSDLHSITDAELTHVLVEKIEKQKPNIIVITGDLIDSGVYMEECLRVEQGAAEGIAGQLTIDFVSELLALAPVYFVYGNHEMVLLDDPEKNTFKVALEKAGVLIANNECFDLNIGTDSINLIGIQDPSTLYKDPGYANWRESGKERTAVMMRAVTENIDEGQFTILLAHRPEYFELYADYPVDLALTGHAHGGQIRIPFKNEGLYAPNQGFFPSYTEGVYTKGSFSMIVSRGLGDSVFPFRIFNGPELIVTILTNNVNSDTL